MRRCLLVCWQAWFERSVTKPPKKATWKLPCPATIVAFIRPFSGEPATRPLSSTQLTLLEKSQRPHQTTPLRIAKQTHQFFFTPSSASASLLAATSASLSSTSVSRILCISSYICAICSSLIFSTLARSIFSPFQASPSIICV
jgi:hypothetical protein